MGLLEDLGDTAGRLAAGAGNAVVRIGRDGGRGAGTVISAGTVLTSAHNLRGREVTVTFGDGHSVRGEVKGVDAEGDLAVVAVDTAAVTPLEWTGEPARIGTPVFAPALLPGGGVRVTYGAVSATGRAFRGPGGRLIDDGVEHTAPVGRGSSGGPVVDSEGRVVGINTHRLGDGFYLALPVTATLRGRVEALARGEAPVRRCLGVALAPPHVARRLRSAVGLAARDGVLVREVGEGTPASAAGLARGDLIVAGGGQEVVSIDGLLAAIDAAGDTITLTVVRGVEELTVEVRFESAE